MVVVQNQVTILWIIILLNKVRDFCWASCHFPLPFVFMTWSWRTWYTIAGITCIIICTLTNCVKNATDAEKLVLYTWAGQSVCAGVKDGQRDREEETAPLWLWSQALGDPEDSQWWTVMRKRKRISNSGRRCTVGRETNSREAMQWKNEQDEGEETAEKLREINMKWGKETRTGKGRQHKTGREDHWEAFIQVDAPEARTLEWIPNSCHGGTCSTSTLLEKNEDSKGSHREFLVELISEERVGQFPEVQLAERPHAVDVLEVNFPCQIRALVRNKLLSETIWRHNNIRE